jgi:hypothetical protein
MHHNTAGTRQETGPITKTVEVAPEKNSGMIFRFTDYPDRLPDRIPQKIGRPGQGITRPGHRGRS